MNRRGQGPRLEELLGVRLEQRDGAAGDGGAAERGEHRCRGTEPDVVEARPLAAAREIRGEDADDQRGSSVSRQVMRSVWITPASLDDQHAFRSGWKSSKNS